MDGFGHVRMRKPETTNFETGNNNSSSSNNNNSNSSSNNNTNNNNNNRSSNTANASIVVSKPQSKARDQ